MRGRSSVLLFSIIATSFYSFNAFADDTASSTFSIDVSNAALQVTAPATASIELNPTSSSAVFGSTNITVNVATNNMTGYTITMTVPTTDLTHGTITGDNAPVIPTLESASTQANFPANAWGYKVTGDNYNPVQLTNTNPSWATENPTNGTDHIITLAAKVDGTKHSGTYTNTLTFNVVANPNPLDDLSTFKILYNPNGGTGSMAYTEVDFGESTTLANSTFTPPENMVFSGWASSPEGAYPHYEAGKPFAAPADATGATYKILYAMWKPSDTPTPTDPCTTNPNCDSTSGTTLQRAYELAYSAAHKGMYEEATAGSNTYTYIDSWNGAHYQGEGRDVRFLIQDMTPEICATATAINSEAIVLDIRDQSSYRIIKAADGRCWMQDNLALDTVAFKSSLSSANTNATDAAIANYINSSGTAPNYGWTTSSVTYETGSSIYTAPRINVTSKNNSSSDSLDSANGWRIGVYYNFCAASAGTYCYGGDGIDRPGTAIDAEYDVCPKGWRLPTGGAYNATTAPDGAEYQNLLDAYYSDGDSSWYSRFRTIMHIPLSGDYYGNSANAQGQKGYFYTSSAFNTYYMGSASSTASSFNAQEWNYYYSDGGRWRGEAIRCIAK